ncbi:ABC transporter permease [Subtercola frigoramans]|uniref:Peptide/nickel transport system permease protein n=1 Tax=Subtercola frigoramans TaxID=120298 RepID=A0ABS2L9B4_9MICO|nr:ABC transporter permease [Subtercola frigoramans]MBM7473680.1 peptide/nickel transport system permease protein [Subtercola frigoramans]
MILSRVAFAIPVLFVMTFLTFFLASLIPGNVALVLLGPSATVESVQALTRDLGLDKPVLVQYFSWVGNALHGDLGKSIYTGDTVSHIVLQRFWPTLSLALLAAVVSAIIGISLGLFAAIKGGALSRILDTLGMVGIAVPGFWIALLLIVVFSGQLRLLPAIGYENPSEDFWGWIRHLILPVSAMALAGIALIAKQTRDAFSEALSRDFIRFLQANGVPRRSLLFRHALRYASVPIVAAFAVTFINFFSATATLEIVFAIPGLGSQVATATANHDLSVLQGAVLAYTIVTVVTILLADIIYSLLNPKVGTR